MIALAAGCLVFQMGGGENVPLSADMVSVEIMGDTAKHFDEEFVSHAAHAVFHYFKEDLGRQTVTVAEFAEALEKALRGFALSARAATEPGGDHKIVQSDLYQLASESGEGCDLFFFPRLRDEFRAQLRQSPQVLRFSGLRGCVKHLAGAQRWSPRCRSLHAEIVGFLRNCLTEET